MNEIIIDNGTKLRVDMDAVLISIKNLPRSRGASASFTALEKGRMYLGEILMLAGHTYPYEATKKAKLAKDIQEATDKAIEGFKVEGNEIEQLNQLRDILGNILDIYVHDILDVFEVNIDTAYTWSIVNREVWKGLKESRMYLGIRLGEIRDNGNTDS